MFFAGFIIFFAFQMTFAQQEKPKICGGGVVNFKTTYFPQPEFPKEAIEKNISDTVTVQVSIDEEGNVTEAKACLGNPIFHLEAEKAALKAKFKQTKLSGVPVKVSGILVYNFNLNDKKIIFGGIVNGKATYLPAPDYPKEAENACAGGKVEVEVLIDEESETVISAKAISGDELLRDAAVEAAKKAKFRRTPDVMPVKVRGIIVYNFEPKVKCLTVGIVNKKAVNLPKPNTGNIIHPKHLQIKKEEIVAILIVVNVEGNVIYTNALAGHPLLRAACENSARRTKFNPTLINGPPIKVKALLACKFQPDGTVETDIESDDKDVIGTPINSVKPQNVDCNCEFGGNSSVLVEAKIDEQGNVSEAKSVSGHPILKTVSEKAALNTKFLPTNIKAKILIKYNFESSGKWTAKFSDIEIKKVEIVTDEEINLGKPINLPKSGFPSTFNGKVEKNSNVLVEIEIDENGNVISANAISGHPILRAMSVASARHSKFSRTTISDVPVKTKALLTYEYILADELIVNIIVNGIEAQK